MTILRSKVWNFEEEFPYLGSNFPSTESYTNLHIEKAWTASDSLLILQKSNFIKAVAVSVLLYVCTTWTLTKRLENMRHWKYIKMLRDV